MEFLDLAWVQWLIGVLAGIFGLWVIPNPWWAKLISFFGAKLLPITNKAVQGLHGLAAIAESAGLEKVGTIGHKLANTIDELDDIPEWLQNATEDGELTKEEIKKGIEETGEFIAVGKDLVIYIVKKPK